MILEQIWLKVETTVSKDLSVHPSGQAQGGLKVTGTNMWIHFNTKLHVKPHMDKTEQSNHHYPIFSMLLCSSALFWFIKIYFNGLFWCHFSRLYPCNNNCVSCWLFPVDWYFISGSITIDGQGTTYKIEGSNSQLDLEGDLFIGGITMEEGNQKIPRELWTGILKHGFVGCVQVCRTVMFAERIKAREMLLVISLSMRCFNWIQSNKNRLLTFVPCRLTFHVPITVEPPFSEHLWDQPLLFVQVGSCSLAEVALLGPTMSFGVGGGGLVG